MSYSRWGGRGTGHWYTYWCTQPDGKKETKDNALFEICGVCSFTSKQLKDNIERCMRIVAKKDKVSEGKLLELKVYMNKFLRDVEKEYS